MQRAGCQQEQAATLGHWLKLQSTEEFLPHQRSFSSTLKAFQLIDSDLPRLSRIISLVDNWLWSLIIPTKYLHFNTYISIGRTVAEAEAPILCPPDVKS